MTTEQLLDKLSSPSWATVSQAVEHAGDFLRTGNPSKDEVATLGNRMVALAGHPKWEVRKAVAHTLQYLRHETFNVAIARLLKDSNSWVLNAAQRSQALRTELTRADVLKEQHGDLLLQWLTDLESKHGPKARRDAVRVAENYAELLVREAKHEIVRVIAPLDMSLMHLEEDVDRSRFDRTGARKHIKRARERLRLLTAIVDSLREYTKQVTPKFARENVREMLEETADLVRDRNKGKADQLAVRVRADPELVVDSDRARLLQAFSNVLQNAFEAYDAKAVGTIRVSARADGGHVVVEVADGGCGMSEEAVRDAIHLYSTSKPDGTGFGLPLAKKIVETEHGGALSLASKKGKGTTVTFVLPIKQAKRQEKQP